MIKKIGRYIILSINKMEFKKTTKITVVVVHRQHTGSLNYRPSCLWCYSNEPHIDIANNNLCGISTIHLSLLSSPEKYFSNIAKQ